jgi:hypothetical protein
MSLDDLFKYESLIKKKLDPKNKNIIDDDDDLAKLLKNLDK